ncbi:MAG: HEPN domain-containing protein [Chloroflexi bacterium]|nr:HEPN domain-containing protein [Chloroflexota bacterium]
MALGEDPPVVGPACFHSQQAAEKALKAALVLEGIEFPYVHDLTRLRNLLPRGVVRRSVGRRVAAPDGVGCRVSLSRRLAGSHTDRRRRRLGQRGSCLRFRHGRVRTPRRSGGIGGHRWRPAVRTAQRGSVPGVAPGVRALDGQGATHYHVGGAAWRCHALP